MISLPIARTMASEELSEEKLDNKTYHQEVGTIRTELCGRCRTVLVPKICELIYWSTFVTR